MAEAYVPSPPPLLVSGTDGVTGASANKLILKHLNNLGLGANAKCSLQCYIKDHFSLRKYDFAYLSHRKEIQPVLQDGPKCGLIALCLAGKALGSDVANVDTIFHTAVKHCYTKQGEMFSASCMSRLAEEVLNCDARVIAGPNLRQQLVDALLHDSVVLVPYDRAPNNEPCLKQGVKAHWALLTGLILEVRLDCLDGDVLNQLEKDKDVCSLYHTSSTSQLRQAISKLDSVPVESASDFTQQKSKHNFHDDKRATKQCAASQKSSVQHCSKCFLNVKPQESEAPGSTTEYASTQQVGTNAEEYHPKVNSVLSIPQHPVPSCEDSTLNESSPLVNTSIKMRNLSSTVSPVPPVSHSMSAASRWTCVYVYAQQGKSRHCHTWPLDSLLASTGQLTCLDPTLDPSNHVIPEPVGIAHGLCGQAVVVSKRMR